jgi:hypothetical protein
MMRCDRATVGKLLDWSVPPAVFHARVHPRALNSGKRLIFNVFSNTARNLIESFTRCFKKGVDRFPNCHV